MSARCEPPPELWGVDGWHWVQCTMGPCPSSYDPEIMLWLSRGEWFDSTGGIGWLDAGRWRYLAPVTPPAEVEALRAERDTLRARVARMEELVHSAYAEGWQDSRIDEYETAADRWEWAAARAALSAETP